MKLTPGSISPTHWHKAQICQQQNWCHSISPTKLFPTLPGRTLNFYVLCSTLRARKISINIQVQKLLVECWSNWPLISYAWKKAMPTSEKHSVSWWRNNKEFLIYWKKFFFEEAPSDSQVVWAIDLIQGLCEMFFVFMWLLLTGKCYIQTTYLAAVH